jgi:hypothetical protein
MLVGRYFTIQVSWMSIPELCLERIVGANNEQKKLLAWDCFVLGNWMDNPLMKLEVQAGLYIQVALNTRELGAYDTPCCFKRWYAKGDCELDVGIQSRRKQAGV